MDDVIEIISEVAEPVVDTLKDWGSDAVDYLREQAKGLKKTTINTVTTVADVVAGEFIHNAHKDSDDDV